MVWKSLIVVVGVFVTGCASPQSANTTQSTEPRCFWQSGDANIWVDTIEVLGRDVNAKECFELDSCNGGDGQSKGGCYKWSMSAKAEALPWAGASRVKTKVPTEPVNSVETLFGELKEAIQHNNGVAVKQTIKKLTKISDKYGYYNYFETALKAEKYDAAKALIETQKESTELNLWVLRLIPFQEPKTYKDERHELFKMLIASPGFKVDQKDTLNFNGATPLERAAEYGYLKGMSLLIQHGADVNAKNNEGETPLHNAVKNGYSNATAMIKLLLKSGANIDAKNNFNRTPLFIVVFFGRGAQREEIIALLLANKADSSIKDHEGFSAKERLNRKGNHR